MATTSLKSLDEQINRLTKKKEQLQAKTRKPVIASIIKQLQTYNITIEELQAAFSAKPARKSSVRKTSSKPVAPKYRHPDTGETWTGRGKPPRWISAAVDGGATRESFLIGE